MRKKGYVGIVLMLVMVIGMWSNGIKVEAAGLFQKQAESMILLGEVQSYGDYELKADSFNTFADKLCQEMRNKQLNVIGRVNMTNENGRHATGGDDDDSILSTIHMDAIIHGHQFDHGYAAAKLVHYADATMGRKYFFDDEKVAAWRKKADVTYHLTPAVQTKAQQIAQKYNAKYLLFVNVKDVDVRLKHNLFASSTDKATRGKKMTAALDYYIINANTGLVYEGHCENKKTAQMVNYLIAQTGKGMSVVEMLNQIMEAQTVDVVNDLTKKGMKAVRK